MVKINPHNSPWNNNHYQIIHDKKLLIRWLAIKKHLTQYHPVDEYYQGRLKCDVAGVRFYIAKNTPQITLKSNIDWAWYTPKSLAQAMDAGNVDVYYETMLKNVHSNPNIWNSKDFELKLKSFYAVRAGRASLIT